MNQPHPPQSLDAEEAVLGAMMLSPAAIEKALDAGLEARDFYRYSHGVIYTTCVEMFTAGDPVDALMLANKLGQDGTLEQVGGTDKIRDIAAMTPAVSNVAHYARIVRDTATRRSILALATAAAAKATNGGTPAELADYLERNVIKLRDRLAGKEDSNATYSDLADQLVERVTNPPARGLGVPTPFSFLPNLLPGRVHILAGETAHGKTACGIQFAAAAAMPGLRVGVAAVEMTKEQMYDRQVAMFGVPLSEVTSGRVSPIHRDAYMGAVQETRDWRIEVNDREDFNAAGIRRWQRIRRFDLLIVDHLHQIVLTGRPGDRRQLLEDEVQGFVSLAKAENVPVLLLAQLSRSTQGPSLRPSLSRLRESGKIEQQAAMVWFCWRETDERGQPREDGSAEWIVAKDRFGPTFSRPMRFDPARVRYVEVAEEERWR